MGTDTCIGDHGVEPIENLEAEIRERDAKLDRHTSSPPADTPRVDISEPPPRRSP
jgi:hypothetical protein